MDDELEVTVDGISYKVSELSQKRRSRWPICSLSMPRWRS
jgi:hypothetical protein